MSQDRGEVPSDGEKLSDRGTPPEETRNTKPTQIAASYDMFGNPLLPASADSTRVPGGDRGNLGQGDRGDLHTPANMSSDAPQTVPIVYTEKKPLSNNVKIAALVGSIFAVGGLVFCLMADPFKQQTNGAIGTGNGGFQLPKMPGRVLNSHEIFKTCGPSIVTLTMATKAYQIGSEKFDIVSATSPDDPVLAAPNEDGDLVLWQKGKQVKAAVGLATLKGHKFPVVIKMSGNQPIIYFIDGEGNVKLKVKGDLAKFSFGAIGSGFFCRPDVVVTNYHVVSQHDLGLAGYQGGTAQITDNAAKYSITRKPIAFDKEHDLALVFVPGTGAKTLPMISDVSTLTVGEPVYALGSPLGAAGSLSEGLISSDKLRGRNLTDPEAEKAFLQHSAKIDHGNSGGPLVNNKGEVIGVNTLGFGNGTVNMAVVTKFIEELLAKPETQKKIDELIKSQQTDLKGGG